MEYRCTYYNELHINSVAGAGIGEGDTYQRVNVYDGSTAVGTLVYLVHQTTTFSRSHYLGRHFTPQGIHIYL